MVIASPVRPAWRMAKRVAKSALMWRTDGSAGL
jgi:hypothetical protein